MTRILGLDIGIGSCGWALVQMADVDPGTGEVLHDFAILGCGSRCFPVPEVPKNKQLKNAARRTARGQRRVIRRRRQRLAAVRKLICANGLPLPSTDAPGTPSGKVWTLRAEALDRVLTPEELAQVLIHLAKHRGFKSNSKRDRVDNQSETGRMLKSISALDQKRLRWRTFGEMLARDPDFADRKRNGKNEYSHTAARPWIEEEAARIFARQRVLGADLATPSLERAFCDAAFFQRPLQEAIELVGACRFESAEQRAPRNAPSFELFRFLSRINNQEVSAPGARPRSLDDEERHRAHALFAQHKSITYKKLRAAMALPDHYRFDGLSTRRVDPETAVFADFTGSVLLKEALGEIRFGNLLMSAPEQLDAAMSALVFGEQPETIAEALTNSGLQADSVDALMDNLGAFARLRGAGHLSSLVCRRLLPHLRQGLVYSAACSAAGYDHTAIGLSRVADLRNPVVAKVLRECTRQIDVLVKTFGMPDRVHLEMARDVGKSPEDRNAIREAGDQRKVDRDRHRSDFQDLLEHEPNDEELLRYELWQEQQQFCPYCGAVLPQEALGAADNSVQIDHILPWSRSGDNSFHNKVLVHTGCNQQKRRQTPFEWFGLDADRWARLEVFAQRCHKQKRRNLLNKSFERRETAYRKRHLQDTRYAMRVLRHELEIRYPELRTEKGDKRRIFTRPGAITALVRRSWGVDQLKRGGELGDRDHALDALVVACTTEQALKAITEDYQRLECEGRGRFVPDVPPPNGNRDALFAMLRDAATAVFVSRPETRRGRGPGHDATLRGLFALDGGGTGQIARTSVIDLKPADLDRVVGDPSRNQILRRVLADWLTRAAASEMSTSKFFDSNPPRMPTLNGSDGPIIRSVRIIRKPSKSGIIVRRGEAIAHADLDTMVRTDIFSKDGKYYLVPVYTYQIANRTRWPSPPMQAIEAHKSENEWPVLNDTHSFLFSLYPSSYVIARNRKGEVFEGYFAGTDRNGGQLTLHPHHGIGKPARPGTRLLASFEKYHVDRLGNRFPIEKEPRLWHGAVCS